MGPPVKTLKCTLPNELVDTIIDHLHDDRSSLTACCLVCKTFLSSSRYHLFSDVCLNDRNSKEILGLPQPSMFSTAARRLMLADKQTLPPGIEYFKSVKAFYLRNTKPSIDMTNRMPLHFPMITVLELNQVVFESFGQMVQLICAFPHLESLTQFMCPWRSELDETPAQLTLSPRLRTLNVFLDELHLFLDWFNGLESPPPLTILRAYGLTEPHMLPVASTIEGLSKSLEHITLGLLDPNYGELLAESLDLSHNSNLQSFTLINGWPKLLYRLLLSHTMQQNLQHLTLTIYEGKGNIPNLDLLDWDELDHLVTAPRTAFRLMDITIRVYAHYLISGVTKEVVEEQYMPLCGAADMVKFVPERKRILGIRGSMKGPISPLSWGEEISN